METKAFLMSLESFSIVGACAPVIHTSQQLMLAMTLPKHSPGLSLEAVAAWKSHVER